MILSNTLTTFFLALYSVRVAARGLTDDVLAAEFTEYGQAAQPMSRSSAAAQDGKIGNGQPGTKQVVQGAEAIDSLTGAMVGRARNLTQTRT